MKRAIKISRADVCKEAARQWRNSERLGLGYTQSMCMKKAWAITKARLQRKIEVELYHSIKREVSRDVINLRNVRPWPAMAGYDFQRNHGCASSVSW